eukprot:CAMPEP_0113643674 /NCGR_PEP_ID=MMETSP0017_2-20120614/22974_1 /TAXON_ID=2856 /ORGANISM="Cylindrotheca closterium" /LENGTH=435 /DNA_ID=CAMNT_0000555221 /DNA_START=170 /DNA_END=1473 /DNA_ORIENTATION=- /assembly_acc=CAM_ASM_000147
MSSPQGRRRRVHSEAHRDLPDSNLAALDGTTLPTTRLSPRLRSKRRQVYHGLACCPIKDRKNHRHDGKNGSKLNLFLLVSCCFVIIPLCYVKLAYHVAFAGSGRSPDGSTAADGHPSVRGSARSPSLPHENSKIQRASTNGAEDETHRIPRILLFTHYRDLLNTPLDDLADEEERILATNIHHSINIHQSDTNTNRFQEDGRLVDAKPQVVGPTQVRFLTDEDCLQSLQKVFPALIPFFLNETQGMFKADICRGSALYETGGVYLDVDIGVRADLWYDLLPTTEFFTSLVHRQSKYPRHFFQAILGAAPKSPIIYKYLELFLDHYTHKDYVEGGPLGVILLRRAWDAVYDEKLETPKTELYQEVLYHPKAFPNLHPAPTWGVRRACHFVVIARAHKEETVEFTIQPRSNNSTSSTDNDLSKVRKYRIPLYSRVGG